MFAFSETDYRPDEFTELWRCVCIGLPNRSLPLRIRRVLLFLVTYWPRGSEDLLTPLLP